MCLLNEEYFILIHIYGNHQNLFLSGTTQGMGGGAHLAVHRGYSQLKDHSLLVGSGDMIGCQGSNLCWACARQIPFPLYFCSALRNYSSFRSGYKQYDSVSEELDLVFYNHLHSIPLPSSFLPRVTKLHFIFFNF